MHPHRDVSATQWVSSAVGSATYHNTQGVLKACRMALLTLIIRQLEALCNKPETDLLKDLLCFPLLLLTLHEFHLQQSGRKSLLLSVAATSAISLPLCHFPLLLQCSREVMTAASVNALRLINHTL